MQERPEIIDTYPEEQPIQLSHLTATMRRYRVVIATAILTVVTATAIVAAFVYLFSYSQRIASIPFLLEFKGANQGEYPNGLRFSVADITANPVLAEVFAVNRLNRFVGFDQFSRAIYVLESNRALEQLNAEYQSKLSDPKLTPVDRERLEREFNSKIASINKSGYAIQFIIDENTKRIPRSLIVKSLNDILAVWARRAAIEKKALDIQVSVLSGNVLDDRGVDGNNYLIPLLLLRRRVDEIASNLDKIADIPGAELVRTPKENTSIEELRLRLDELARLRIEPLIGTARATGQTGASAAALQILKAQLAYDERILAAARMREEALRNALLTYDSQASAGTKITPERTTTASANAGLGRQQGETVMPQLSEGFLDRIVDLTRNNAEREYRQKLNDDIKKASLNVIPLEQTVRYDRELIDSFQRPTVPGTGVSSALLTQQWQNVIAEARHIVAQMNEIYLLASRQLNPSTELYRITAPPVFRVERTISTGRIAAFSFVAILIAVPLILVGVLLHNRIREEEAMERHARTAQVAAS